MTYAQAITQLETIVQKLQNGQMDIDILAANLKEAQKLIDFCQQKLTKVETDISKILGEDKD